MPELPDLEDYLAAMRPRMVGTTITRVDISGVSLLKTFDPPVEAAVGRRVNGLRRLGKRLIWEIEGDEEPWFFVLHLMIAGRLRWKAPGTRPPGKVGLASFGFTGLQQPTQEAGSLILTEAGTRKRANLHLIRGERALAEHDRGGLEPLETSLADFTGQLSRENRTLKRALTDQHLFAGIGNAYSDEILHAARLSPLRLTSGLDQDEVARLHGAVVEVLRHWMQRLRSETGEGFPEKVTAFREDFAVHGRYGKDCPACGTKVQRIRYADNEVNYCPRCQTGGRILADRAMSRLLKDDWPRNLDDAQDAH